MAAPPDLTPAQSPSIARTHVSGETTVEQLPRGTVLGRYTVVGFLGEGGMATVYSAYDPELDRRVALKLLKIRDLDLEAARAQLQHEAQLMARLSHPNVVSVHDAGTLEFVDGQTLRAWLQERPRSLTEVIEAFVSAGEGLAAAHAKGLVHRDFKPDNVLVGREGRVQVSDFGLARIAHKGSRSGENEREEDIAGTPAYMAPEQFLGKLTDPRTDQFSFCAALWEALTGELPYGGSSLGEIRRGVLEGELRPPARKVPRWLLRALQKGLSRDPAARFLSLKALLAVLRRDRARRIWRTAGVTVPMLGLLGVLAILGYHWRQDATTCARAAEARRAEILVPAQRAEVARSFKKAAEGQAVLAELDEKLASWATLQEAACKAAERSDPTSRKTLDCLEVYRIDAKTIVGWLARPQEVGDAGRILLDEIDTPRDRCQRTEPTSQAATAGIGLREEVAGVKVLYALGRYKDAAAKARPLVLMARSQGALGLASEIEDYLGMSLVRSAGPQPEALEVLHQGVWDADAAGDDWRSFRVRMSLLSVLGEEYGRSAEARELLKASAAWLQRLGKPPTLELEWVGQSATVVRNSDIEEALRLDRRALEIVDKERMPSTQVALAHHNLGADLLVAHRWAEAERELKAAADEYHRGHYQDPAEQGVTRTLLAVAQSRQGRAGEALATLDRAAEIAKPLEGQEESDRLWTLSYRALVLEDLGRLDEAEAAYREVASAEAAEARPRSRAGQARILLSRGQAKQALPLAQQALDAAKASVSSGDGAAFARFALAQAMWDSGGNRTEAVALAKAALAAFASPEDGFFRSPIERWLATHKPPR